MYNKGSIRPVDILPGGTVLYRARLMDTNLTLDKLAENPTKELSAPPRGTAKPGRMNVEFIPVFYAAFSEDTSIAELRPGIGDSVAVGEFTLSRELKVFDFTAFDRASPNERVGHTRYEFISQIQNEISKPIRAMDRLLEYIPTQIVAEFLHEEFKCDAIIYRSAMHKDGTQDNRNMVIFSKDERFVGDSQEGIVSLSTWYQVTISNVTYELDK